MTLDVAKTVTGADNPGDFSFTAELTSGNADGVQSGLDGDGKLHATVAGGLKDGQTSKANFPELTFSKAGTYTFKVTEDGAAAFNADTANRNGWTYDDTERTVTVVVENNGRRHPERLLRGRQDPRVRERVRRHRIRDPRRRQDGDGRRQPRRLLLHRRAHVRQRRRRAVRPRRGRQAPRDGGGRPQGRQTSKANFPELTFSKAGTYTFKVTEDGAARVQRRHR